VINEPLALKGLMRARALFKQPSRATPTFRLVAIMVIEFVQIAVNSRLPAAGARDERKSDAHPLCVYALISNPFILKRNAPRHPFVVHLVVLNSTL
jgi:hypothetical protein